MISAEEFTSCRTNRRPWTSILRLLLTRPCVQPGGPLCAKSPLHAHINKSMTKGKSNHEILQIEAIQISQSIQSALRLSKDDLLTRATEAELKSGKRGCCDPSPGPSLNLLGPPPQLLYFSSLLGCLTPPSSSFSPLFLF